MKIMTPDSSWRHAAGARMQQHLSSPAISPALEMEKTDDLGNTNCDRFPLRHGNHDVRLESLIRGASAHVAANPRLRGGRRLSAMELQLSSLSRRAQRDVAGPCANAVLACGPRLE
jgi:hypothetical protein